jgi:hypothetical protein
MSNIIDPADHPRANVDAENRARRAETVRARKEELLNSADQERGADPRQFDTDLLLLTPLQQDGLIEVTGRQFIMIEAGR